ncbi:hypothetical protein Tco_0812386, partial [Tanacetum coccineum]
IDRSDHARFRPPEQTSGAELRSRTSEKTSDPDNLNETSNAGMVLQR